MPNDPRAPSLDEKKIRLIESLLDESENEGEERPGPELGDREWRRRKPEIWSSGMSAWIAAAIGLVALIAVMVMRFLKDR